jgi:hypothetical protein
MVMAASPSSNTFSKRLAKLKAFSVPTESTPSRKKQNFKCHFLVVAENASTFTAPARHPNAAEPFDVLKGILEVLFRDIDDAPPFGFGHGFTIKKASRFSLDAKATLFLVDAVDRSLAHGGLIARARACATT